LLTVTVKDNETGQQQTVEVPEDDYFVVATGACRYTVNAYANGTHVVTFKGRKPGLTAPATDRRASQ
jgi:hypothetical protein